MATGWVIDHPAHARLLAPMIREMSSPEDVFIACDRFEVRSMLEFSDGHLPRRKTVWVPRPIGKGKWKKAYSRMRISTRALKDVDLVISVGAPLELRAAPRSARRIYITDTEVNHKAHRLVKATDIVIPSHFKQEYALPLMKKKAKFHRLNGLHGHVHLRPQLRPKQVSDPPRIMMRKLIGDGIHDSEEILKIPSQWLNGLDLHFANENQVEGDPWQLDSLIASMDGVITQSVTLASEAVILGVPTLLVTKAVRGFLDRLVEDGYPLFITRDADEEVYTNWLAGLHLTDSLDLPEWPNTRSQLLEILQD